MLFLGALQDLHVALAHNLKSSSLHSCGYHRSIAAAGSVARQAQDIAAEDQQVMTDLARTGGSLSSAIDATKSITRQLKGAQGGEGIDAVSDTMDQTASIVSEDLSAAASIADAVERKFSTGADAVLAMKEKAGESVATIKAAEGSIGESGGESSDSISRALTKDAEDIQLDEDAAKNLGEVISKDVMDEEEALGALERTSSKVDSLIDAVNGAMDKALGDTASKASTGGAPAALDTIEKKVEEVEHSMSNLEKAREEAEETEDVKVESVASAAEETERGAEVNTGDRPEEDEQHLPQVSEDDLSSSGVEEEKARSSAQNELSKNDSAQELPPIEKATEDTEKIEEAEAKPSLTGVEEEDMGAEDRINDESENPLLEEQEEKTESLTQSKSSGDDTATESPLENPVATSNTASTEIEETEAESAPLGGDKEEGAVELKIDETSENEQNLAKGGDVESSSSGVDDEKVKSLAKNDLSRDDTSYKSPSIEKTTEESEDIEKTEAKSSISDIDKEERSAEAKMNGESENEQNLAVGETDSSSSSEREEKVEALAQNESPRDDFMRETPPENPRPAATANEGRSSEQDSADVDSSAAAIADANHHGQDSLVDAILNTADKATVSFDGDHLVDAVLANDNPSVSFQVSATNAGSFASELGNSIQHMMPPF